MARLPQAPTAEILAALDAEQQDALVNLNAAQRRVAQHESQVKASREDLKDATAAYSKAISKYKLAEARWLARHANVPSPLTAEEAQAIEEFAHALPPSPPHPDLRDAVNANLRLVDE